MFKFSKTQNVPSSPPLYCQRLETVVWLSPWKVGLPSRNYFHQPPTWYPDLVTKCEKSPVSRTHSLLRRKHRISSRSQTWPLRRSQEEHQWLGWMAFHSFSDRSRGTRLCWPLNKPLLPHTSQSASKLCKSLSLVAARCSYNLWLHRENKKWKMGPLLTPNAPDTKSSGVGLARHA